jgi:hypothetical protein
VSSGFGRVMTEHILVLGDRVAGTVRSLSVMDDLEASMATVVAVEARSVRDRKTLCNIPSLEMLSEHVSGTS